MKNNKLLAKQNSIFRKNATTDVFLAMKILPVVEGCLPQKAMNEVVFLETENNIILTKKSAREMLKGAHRYR